MMEPTQGDGVRCLDAEGGVLSDALREGRADAALVEAFGLAWAEALGADERGVWASVSVSGVWLRLRRIPPGTFAMGAPGRERSAVTISRGFWLGDTPVTQAMWRVVMGDDPSNAHEDVRPVEQVTWEECVDFGVRLSELVPALRWRLPTEAEWEHACRAGAQEDWLGAAGLDEVAWHAANAEARTHPVGLKAPNRWGLFDMLGNVQELCVDKVDRGPTGLSAPPRMAVDPVQEVGALRVCRGGSWYDSEARVRAGARTSQAPHHRSYGVGLRVAADAT
ncbi:MAG: formylglycine-generating enzyme family protein [Myxococcales bacterium]|nr:formylglycine-generating enzyme family protein [Myxococcales bacterium]